MKGKKWKLADRFSLIAYLDIHAPTKTREGSNFTAINKKGKIAGFTKKKTVNIKDIFELDTLYLKRKLPRVILWYHKTKRLLAQTAIVTVSFRN